MCESDKILNTVHITVSCGEKNLYDIQLWKKKKTNDDAVAVCLFYS